MVKRGFTVVEICIVIFVILGAAFVFLPKGIESTKQAKFIAKWSQKYTELQYMFSVIKSEFDVQGYYSAPQFEDKIENHLRISGPINKVYRQYLKNGKELKIDSLYSSDKYYLDSNNEIIGFKWVNKQCEDSELCAVITFDVNGYEPPNVFGEDIFGITVSKNKVVAFGEGEDQKELKKDCETSGVYCSYYYLIGGRFD